MNDDVYQNPLITRYASREMAQLWGMRRRTRLWRQMWIALAESQRELGLDITEAQIEEMRRHVDDIDLDRVAHHEKIKRHDVMAHVEAFGEVAPSARPIMHLGATSCFVTDNTDLLLLRDALRLVAQRLAIVIQQLGEFARQYGRQACLGFTHLQAAQPTTIGKRACLWAYDLVLDLEEIETRLERLQARSVKGTTGTQASLLALFNGDHEKVVQLERLVADKMGFSSVFPVTGQTYPRKIDTQILDSLSGIAQSAHKAATDIRIMASRKEMDEPFETGQVGSSAMPYKRNPMRSERICALARFLISLQSSPAHTLATQWMERTLDDSANRRLVLPQGFLAADAVLKLYQNITSGLVVYPKVMERHLLEELPFMASEDIMMAGVLAGGDRQQLHHKIRDHAQQAAARVKGEGKPNDLIDRLKQDPAFAQVDVDATLDISRYVGRAPQQVEEFVDRLVTPIAERYADAELSDEINV